MSPPQARRTAVPAQPAPPLTDHRHRASCTAEQQVRMPAAGYMGGWRSLRDHTGHRVPLSRAVAPVQAVRLAETFQAAVARPRCEVIPGERVRLRHPTDGISELRCDQWTTKALPPAEPGPVIPEAPALPLDDSGWLDEDEGIPRTGPGSGEPTPGEAVVRPDMWSPLAALVHGQLTSERQDLELRGDPGAGS